MRIVSIGAGPGGLYFGILMKQAFPEVEIEIVERNRPDDTFGWGVVFSDETLDRIREADAATYAAIEARFIHWTDIHTWYSGECVRSTGHGFSGLSRKRLLEILQGRAKDVGVKLEFEREIRDVAEVGECDLLLGADGIHSIVRDRWSEHFEPHLDWRPNKFCWLGLDRELPAFSFWFRENEHGLFQIHAYPFEEGRSTFIVECSEETWRKAELDGSSEARTVEYVSELFSDALDGASLLTNRSIWRSFPTITNARWHHGNAVLIGDSAHTAHFSIGSGTKLAMEDSIALVEAFREHGIGDVPKVLAAYEESRRVDVIKTQKAAQTSLEWFENSSRYLRQHPLQFQFNLMTRSKRITYENLGERDPELVERVTDWFARDAGQAEDSRGHAPAPMFTPFRLRGMQLANRIVVSPMCQYSAREGVVNDWHLVHLGGRAVGGASLVLTEMTNVAPEGRITHGCAGLWNDAQEEAWARVVRFVHKNTEAKIGIQLAHAGRKGSCHLPWEGDSPLRDETAWQCIGPSAEPFDTGWPPPRAMVREDFTRIRDAFVSATRRALAADFDCLELHMAHGYLLSSFLSPASNRRVDDYGGDLEGRMKFPLEVFEAVRAVWPEDRPISVRISATDWLEPDEGWKLQDSVVFAGELFDRGLDLLDVSSAGNTPRSNPVYGRMYQVPFADRIRHEVGIPVLAVGAIQGPDHANTVLAAGRADLCALARPHLIDPHLTLRASIEYDFADQAWPKQYLPARPRPRRDPAEGSR